MTITADVRQAAAGDLFAPSHMRAVAVRPGVPDSMHLTTIPRPQLDDVPGGRGVLVQVVQVGVDGTDKEINNADYGAAPPGSDVLVTGLPEPESGFCRPARTDGTRQRPAFSRRPAAGTR